MSALVAGRATDAQVAEKVMGLTVRRGWVRDGYYEMEMEVLGENEEPIDGMKHFEDFITGNHCVPRYSTDIAAAWQVVEHLVSSGRFFFRLSGAGREPDTDPVWQVTLAEYPDDETTVETRRLAYTVPLAICSAALAAVNAAER